MRHTLHDFTLNAWKRWHSFFEFLSYFFFPVIVSKDHTTQTRSFFVIKKTKKPIVRHSTPILKLSSLLSTGRSVTFQWARQWNCYSPWSIWWLIDIAWRTYTTKFQFQQTQMNVICIMFLATNFHLIRQRSSFLSIPQPLASWIAEIFGSVSAFWLRVSSRFNGDRIQKFVH